MAHRLPHRFLTTIAAAITLSLPCAASAAENPAPSGLGPATVSTVGTMRVEAYGAGSPAIVFIPGLSCGSWEWRDTAAHFAAHHAVYIVTLDGFDGLPATTAPMIDKADSSLLALVQDDHLDRPILVGHSLGGFLALRFGTEHPDLVRGIVSVDGTPVFPALVQSTPDQRASAAAGAAASIRGADAAQYKAYETQAVAMLVTDPANAARVAAETSNSDPQAVAEYLQELLSADLRPELPKLTAPTLEIAPVPTVPAPYEGPAAATMTIAQRSPQYVAFYQMLFAAAPNVTVDPILNSRHFVMVDRPHALDEAIAAFVSAHAGP